MKKKLDSASKMKMMPLPPLQLPVLVGGPSCGATKVSMAKSKIASLHKKSTDMP